MVIVRLIGGLGNQMFQYALGRALASRHAVPLKLDLSGYREYTLHGYRLDHLKIAAEVAEDGDLPAFRQAGRIGSRIAKILGNLGLAAKVVREDGFQFKSAVLDTRPPLYLEGYWQSEKYFARVAGELRSEFALREPMDAQNLAMAARIAGCNSVAIHVRRGDYVSNPTTNEVHGTCGLDYYDRACACIAERVESAHAFVFSDDIGWARANLRVPFPVTFVDLNGDARNHLDLHLMAACRHQIIANSSFSWWAAWLNPNVDKAVVAPRRWFRRQDIDTRDLLPPAWLAI
jgi:hypothetical protein